MIRIDHEYRSTLTLDPSNVPPLPLDATETRQIAELAPTIDGKPDVTKISEIQIGDLARRFRVQKTIFEIASDIFDQMKPTCKGSRESLLAQLFRLVEKFLESGHIHILPAFFGQDELRRRLVLVLNMSAIVQHM